ncbi:MCM domain-containing protein 2-like [Elysia marginata]|uniref:MCM domain-containing protein 2-like n=1 Tax=Elysia marginata TaxID=1093978 RepID=A0AAV4EM22_9GAST|nr:MCM domain-containing protein 2-like [Elysia marginata]
MITTDTNNIGDENEKEGVEEEDAADGDDNGDNNSDTRNDRKSIIMIVFQFCRSHQLLSPETTPTQICARLRVVSFPSGCDSLQISSVSNLNKCIDYSGFVLVTGVVVGISGSAKYTQSTKYVCPGKNCEGSDGHHFIRMHIPGASENQTIRNDFRCSFCGDVLVEVTSSRTLSDKILVEVTPVSLIGPSLKEVFKSGRLQSVPVYVRDELLDVVGLGDACQVVGISRTDVNGETIDVTLELKKSMAGYGLKLPDAIQTIFASTKESAWSFPLNMAYHFGDQIVPCGAMIKLRLLLLISLVLNPKKHPLHILSLGSETSLVMSLCQHALKFSQRSFPAMVGTPLCGKYYQVAKFSLIYHPSTKVDYVSNKPWLFSAMCGESFHP